jgi:hypothetical protein
VSAFVGELELLNRPVTLDDIPPALNVFDKPGWKKVYRRRISIGECFVSIISLPAVYNDNFIK